VWQEALRSVLGPDEWWERFAQDPNTAAGWTEADAERYERVVAAWVAIVEAGVSAGREWEHSERLFGKAADRPEVYSPGWTALFAAGADESTPVGRPDLIVGNYLVNVRDGLMDATGMFHDLDEAES
jgi:hypothetical protein